MYMYLNCPLIARRIQCDKPRRPESSRQISRSCLAKVNRWFVFLKITFSPKTSITTTTRHCRLEWLISINCFSIIAEAAKRNSKAPIPLKNWARTVSLNLRTVAPCRNCSRDFFPSHFGEYSWKVAQASECHKGDWVTKIKSEQNTTRKNTTLEEWCCR